jgi:hypothetical protein
MPTVLWFGGLRVTIYPNDHRPAHVHFVGQGHEAVFTLNCPAGPVALRENYGFSRCDLARMHGPLHKNLAALCSAWESYHGLA